MPDSALSGIYNRHNGKITISTILTAIKDKKIPTVRTPKTKTPSRGVTKTPLRQSVRSKQVIILSTPKPPKREQLSLHTDFDTKLLTYMLAHKTILDNSKAIILQHVCKTKNSIGALFSTDKNLSVFCAFYGTDLVKNIFINNPREQNPLTTMLDYNTFKLYFNNLSKIQNVPVFLYKQIYPLPGTQEEEPMDIEGRNLLDSFNQAAFGKRKKKRKQKLKDLKKLIRYLKQV